MFALLILIIGICTIISGKNLKEAKTDKKIEKLFGKILSSDHIDELAEKIAVKAVEKFNNLQQSLVVTLNNNTAVDNTPILRVRKVAETAYTDPPPPSTPEEEYTEFPTAAPTHPPNADREQSMSDPNFLIQSPNLPLKNLGYKYRKQTKEPTPEVEENYEPMAGDDKNISNNKPPIDHSFLQDSMEASTRPLNNKSDIFDSNEKGGEKMFERSEEQHFVDQKTLRNRDQSMSKEQMTNDTVHEGENVYSSGDQISREQTETTTLRSHITRVENNKLYAYQSSAEYEEYHQNLARTPITEVMYRRQDGGDASS